MSLGKGAMDVGSILAALRLIFKVATNMSGLRVIRACEQQLFVVGRSIALRKDESTSVLTVLREIPLTTDRLHDSSSRKFDFTALRPSTVCALETQ